MSQEFKTITTVTIAEEEYRIEIEKALYTVLESARANENCLWCELHVDFKNPHTYICVDAWKSLEAILAHQQSAPFRHFTDVIAHKVTDFQLNAIERVY